MTKRERKVFLVSMAAVTILWTRGAAQGEEPEPVESFFDGYEKNFTVQDLAVGELPAPPEGTTYITGFQDNATESQNATSSQDLTENSLKDTGEPAEPSNSAPAADAQEVLKVFKSQ
jgi:hypothetical protein